MTGGTGRHEAANAILTVRGNVHVLSLVRFFDLFSAEALAASKRYEAAGIMNCQSV